MNQNIIFVQKENLPPCVFLRRGYGFTTIELMFALVIIVGLFITTNSYMNTMFKIKKGNQTADLINNYQIAAIKYINDNYRQIYQQTIPVLPSGLFQDMIVPGDADGLKIYYPTGVSAITSNFQSPCLYITRNLTNSDIQRGSMPFYAYLVFGARVNNARKYTLTEAMAIAQSIGGNAGVLVPGSNGFTIAGMNIPDSTVLPYDWALGTQCGFINGHGAIGLLDYSIIVDLSKNSQLFAQLRIKSDRFSGDQDKDPSLKKNGSGDDTTMQTNLYLDNIIKESGASSYCDATILPTNAANALCQNYASAKGIYMYPGTSYWSSSIQRGGSCTATASAHFYTTGNSCNMGDPADYCPASFGDKIIITGTAYWDPLSPVPSGDKCISTAYAKYVALPSCDGPVWWINQMDPNSRGDGDPTKKWNWQRAVTGGKIGQYMSRFISCAIKQPDDHDTMVHCPGKYNQSTGYCDVGLRCMFQGICATPLVNASFPPESGTQPAPIVMSCGQQQIDAPTLDIGFMNCGTAQYPLQTSSTGAPAEHRYRAVDFGAVGIAKQRVQIKSAAPDGATVNAGQLAIRSAGVEAGYVSPQSHPIAPGTSCANVELGKMAQQVYTNSVTATQLQCTYSPVFCGGTGYCYIPIKSPGIIYNYSVPRTSGTCPPGSVVSANQPANAINKDVPCSALSGATLIETVHGEMAGCHSVVSNISFCSEYQALCTYRDDNSGNIIKVPAAALMHLQCSSAANTFTIDDYKAQ